jgi:excinuclease ABC subunit C
MNLKDKINKLPSTPGVYLMKDSLNSTIYVGKSKNLKNRVGSYFINSKSHSPKIVKLVKNIKDFEYILTDTEFEAFMLECKLIKEIKPIYNRIMKNPLSYCYIKISITESYPGIEISNEHDKNDGNLYFGPYTNRNTVERAIQGIKECCKILCSSKPGKFSAAACLNYSLGLCIGICTDESMHSQYILIINKVIMLLNREDNSIILQMEHLMNTASENFDFEGAAKYRDYITAVNYLVEKEQVIEFAEKNKKIAMVEYLSSDSFKLFLITGNKVLFSYKYILANYDLGLLKKNIKDNLSLYLEDKCSKSSFEIGRDELDESQIIYSYLKRKSNDCNFIVIPEDFPDDKAVDKLLDILIKQPYAH